VKYCCCVLEGGTTMGISSRFRAIESRENTRRGSDTYIVRDFLLFWTERRERAERQDIFLLKPFWRDQRQDEIHIVLIFNFEEHRQSCM
jgi:hypothetical protein